MACNQTPYYPSGTYRPDCYAGDGGTTTFSVTFAYINQSQHDGSNSPYIKVFLFNSTLGTLSELSRESWSMPTSTSVQLSTAPSSTEEVWIVRDTSVNGRLVDYAGGSTVSDSTLDLDSLQAWYLWEESVANGELLQTEASDKNYFGAEFEFTGDGSTTEFTLDDGETAIQVELSKISLWIFLNGVFVQSDDFTTDLDTAGVVTVDLGEAPADGDDILIRVAQQTSLAVNLDDDSIDTAKLQDCSVTIEKLCLDGDGTDKQVASWTGGGGTFGANTLTSEWVSDFDDAVRDNRLDQMAVPTSDLDANSNKITNLSDPTADQDAATKSYVDAAVEENTTSSSVVSGTVSFASPGSTTVELPNNPKWVKYIRTEAAITNQNDSEFMASQFPWNAGGSPRTLTVSTTGSNITFTTAGSGVATCNIEYVIIVGD